MTRTSAGKPGGVGLVLGAGGVVGHAFHAGVLRAIAEATGWDPRRADLVVGTSAGSVVGASLRAGLSAHDLMARAADEPLSVEGAGLLHHVPPAGGDFTPLPRTGLPRAASPRILGRAVLRPWDPRLGLLMAGLLPEGRVSAEPIAAGVRAVLAAGGLGGDLWVVGVRLRDGRRVVFGRDHHPSDWGTAVAASCAIPGFFAPVELDGTRYVDGGAHSPTNADVVDAARFELVVVVSPMSASRSARLRRLDTPVRTMYRLRLAAELAGLRRAGTPVLVFQPTAADLAVMGTLGRASMDESRRAPVARQAYASALRRFDRPETARLGDRLRALAA